MHGCRNCGPLPESDFYKRSQAAGGGLMSECKECFLSRPRDRKREQENLQAWRVKNPEKVRAQTARWRARHPEQKRLSNLQRHSIRRSLTDDDLLYIQIIGNDPCSYCYEPMGHVDHIEPVALDGASDWTNFTPACASCNQSKSDKTLLVFLGDR